VHNFVYLAKVHEPLVKHEKNLGVFVCVFVCRVVKYLKYVIKYMACNFLLYFIQFRNVFCIL